MSGLVESGCRNSHCVMTLIRRRPEVFSLKTFGTAQYIALLIICLFLDLGTPPMSQMIASSPGIMQNRELKFVSLFPFVPFLISLLQFRPGTFKHLEHRQPITITVRLILLFFIYYVFVLRFGDSSDVAIGIFVSAEFPNGLPAIS
jgi:hypothetical protein